VADFRELGGQLAMEELLAAPERPEAVFVNQPRRDDRGPAGHRPVKAGHPRRHRRRQLRRHALGPLLKPSLTTVAQPAYDTGIESARLLLSRLEGYKGAARMVILSPSLKVRGALWQNVPLPPGARAFAGNLLIT